jgi:hypothetical protein
MATKKKSSKPAKRASKKLGASKKAAIPLSKKAGKGGNPHDDIEG